MTAPAVDLSFRFAIGWKTKTDRRSLKFVPPPRSGPVSTLVFVTRWSSGVTAAPAQPCWAPSQLELTGSKQTSDGDLFILFFLSFKTPDMPFAVYSYEPSFCTVQATEQINIWSTAAMSSNPYLQDIMASMACSAS